MVRAANRATVATAGTAGVWLGNNDDGYINKFSCRCYFHASTIDGRTHRRSVVRRARGRIAVLVSCLRLLSHDYARTNNFVQTRHPLAKPLNTAANYVTWLKIQRHAYTRLVKFVYSVRIKASREGYSCTFYTNRLNR